MRSSYHVALNHTQETAEHKAEKLENTDILIMGPNDFRERFVKYLKEGEKTPISDEYGRQATFASDEDGPKIIAEQEASFCTLLLAFNEKGEGIVYHYPLIDFLGPNGELPQNVADEINTMKEFVKNTGGHILVTGTNLPQAERDVLLQALSFEEDRNIVIMTDGSESDRFREGSEILANNIQGICFIPKQLSNDSRNKIILLAQRINKNEFDEQLRPIDLLDRGYTNGSKGFAVR